MSLECLCPSLWQTTKTLSLSHRVVWERGTQSKPWNQLLSALLLCSGRRASCCPSEQRRPLEAGRSSSKARGQRMGSGHLPAPLRAPGDAGPGGDLLRHVCLHVLASRPRPLSLPLSAAFPSPAHGTDFTPDHVSTSRIQTDFDDRSPIYILRRLVW